MSNNVNAIKYILNKRNMKQQELVFDPFSRQYVSKVITRHFRIPESLISEWTKILRIPPKCFVDDNGKCKQLNSLDLREIDSYIESQFFIENEKELEQFIEVEYALRQHNLNTGTMKLQRSIRKDIYAFPKDIDDKFELLEAQESNLQFYEKIIALHRTRVMDHREWNSFFRAFNHVANNDDADAIKNDTALVYGMYILLKRSRELNAIQQYELHQDYEELFGALVDNLDEHNK